VNLEFLVDFGRNLDSNLFVGFGHERNRITHRNKVNNFPCV
jgi:hypothetical protein